MGVEKLKELRVTLVNLHGIENLEGIMGFGIGDTVFEICDEIKNLDNPPKSNSVESANNTQQLKAKIASVAEKLKKFNYYGAQYHIREIMSVVNELRQLSAV